jgi:hypothetical protein
MRATSPKRRLGENSTTADISPSATAENGRILSVTKDGTFVATATEMILRIVEESGDKQIVLRLIGRIESEHLHDLEAHIANQTRTIVLDLSEIKLVNEAAVRFLRVSEDQGIELRNCPSYVREWIRLDRRAGDEAE